MADPDWLVWAREIQAIAQTGLEYSPNAYDRERFQALQRLAARIMAQHTGADLARIESVLRHLLAARDTVLAVNAAYIASAAQSPETRTEPPFLLQGSYRDMNAVAARLDPAMNPAEAAAVVDDHYTAAAQTLATGAEFNLLRLGELRGALTPEEGVRLKEIRAAHVRARALTGAGGGPEADPARRAAAALSLLADRAAAIESAILRAAERESHAPRHPR
jgi:hypothetical protein